MQQNNNRRLVFVLSLALVVSVSAVYWPVHKFDFINYDDPVYVTENPQVLQGLSADGVKWAFGSMYGSNWFPLTWLSLMLDRQLFGIDPAAFHLVNVALHIINTVLLFLLFVCCTRSIWPGFFVAAAFGLVPFHVESVAWITERKDVLSTVFWMLTMLAYVRYAQRPTTARYILVPVMFALGLMAKPMLVTLPFVLLLFDYWPLERLRQKKTGSDAAGKTRPLSWLLLEKAPLFALSAASSVVTFIAQSRTVSTLRVFSLSDRITNAIVAYATYIAKTFWPTRLAIFYPHPQGTIPLWQVAVSATVLVIISVMVFVFRRRRYLVTGWLWYLGTLVPVIGLVQVGAQAMADRYTYIPLTGLFIMLAWLVRDLVAARRSRAIAAVAFGLVLCAAFSALTVRQLGYWRDSITLFSHTLDVTKDNYVAHNNLGIALAERGELAAAMRQFEATLNIRPDDRDAHFNLAKALAKVSRPDEAMEHYKAVLRLRPGDADTYGDLASLQAEQGRFEQAIAIYRKALSLNPDDGRLHSGLGLALLRAGRLDEAIVELKSAVQIKPDSTAYCNLGMAVSFKGDSDKAMDCYKRAIRLDPGNAEAYYNLGNAFLAKGRLNEAILQYKKAIRLRPDYIKAHGNLAVTLAQQGKLDEAIRNFEIIIDLEPNSPDVHFNLASTLLEKGDTGRAVEQLRKVVELVPQDVGTRCALAELLLRQDKIEQAISEYRQALKINPNSRRAGAGLNKALAVQNSLQK